MKKESACETKTENVYFSTPKPFSSLLSSAPKFSSIRPPKPNKKRSQSVDGPRIPTVNAHPSVTDDTVTEVTNSQQSNETSKSMKMTNSCSLMPEETFAKVVAPRAATPEVDLPIQSSPKSKRYCLTRRKTSTLFNSTGQESQESQEEQSENYEEDKKDPDLAELILETQTENCERTRDASSHVPQSDSILMCQTDISSDQFHSLSSYSLLNQVRDVISCKIMQNNAFILIEAVLTELSSIMGRLGNTAPRHSS